MHTDAVSYEIFPSPGIVDDVATHLPWGAEVSVTVAPTSGFGPTLAVAEELTRLGFTVTAHLAGRMFASKEAAVDAAHSLQAAGVKSALLLAGDQNPALGPIDGAWDLYRTLVGNGASFDRVLFAAYPQGHPHLATVASRADILTKSAVTDGFVSQLCLSAASVRAWLEDVRGDGIVTPIRIGVPGPVLASRLTRISRQLGVAEPGIDEQHDSDRYDPSAFVDELARSGGGLPIGTALHIYTFNDVAEARGWVDVAESLPWAGVARSRREVDTR